MLLLHALLKKSSSNKLGISSTIIGKDQRVSTSKLQVFLWTCVVVFGLLAVLFYILLIKSPQSDLFALKEQYLILLGSPAAAALVAKASTTSKDESGTITKTTASESPGAITGLTQVVADDQGQVDPFDFQYFLFTIVALIYFFVFFLPNPGKGLPDLPNTIVGLTGVSAAGYAAKKALERQVPVLTGVFPAEGAPGVEVRIRGNNLIAGQEDSPDEGVAIFFGTKLAQNIRKGSDEVTDVDEFVATVPKDLVPGAAVPIKLRRADGTSTTNNLDFSVTGKPRITAVRPTQIVLDHDDKMIISGNDFGQEDTKVPPTNAIMLSGRDLKIDNWSPDQVTALLPSLAEAKSANWPLGGSAELIVINSFGSKSDAEQVHLQ